MRLVGLKVDNKLGATISIEETEPDYTATIAQVSNSFGFDQIVSQLYLGSDGILGVPTLVSATYIFFVYLVFWNFSRTRRNDSPFSMP